MLSLLPGSDAVWSQMGNPAPPGRLGFVASVTHASLSAAVARAHTQTAEPVIFRVVEFICVLIFGLLMHKLVELGEAALVDLGAHPGYMNSLWL